MATKRGEAIWKEREKEEGRGGGVEMRRRWKLGAERRLII